MKLQWGVVVANLIWLAIPLHTVAADAPPHAWRLLIPGEATRVDVLAALGPPPIETERQDDLRYPVEGTPELNDRLYFRDGVLALVTAASGDTRYPDRSTIEDAFGKPEAEVLFRTQQYLDYSEHGLRFICDSADTTTGVIYFAPRRRRVPRGYPNERIDLRRTPREDAGAVEMPADSRVGAAQRTITPVELSGLTPEPVDGLYVAEDLYVRAAVFQCGKQRIALAGLDVFGLGLHDVDRIRDALADAGLDQVVIAMSHTHANADTIGFYGHYPDAYVEFIVEQTVQVVLDANADLRPIRQLRLGSVEMPLAGGRVVDLVRNGRDPGLVDPTVSVIQAVGEDGRPIVNVLHLACHPEVIDLDNDPGLSPDFVGTLCREMTRRVGGQTVFLNGALGGMLTPDTPFRTQAAAEEMGRRLADFAVRAVEASEPSDYRLGWHHRPVQFPITAESVLTFLQNAPWPVELIDGRVATGMNVLWIGGAQLITVPGELLPDIGFEIMSHMRGRQRLIVGLANGELGYLVPSFDFRAGHYEESTGPGAAGGEIVRGVGLELAPWLPGD